MNFAFTYYNQSLYEKCWPYILFLKNVILSSRMRTQQDKRTHWLLIYPEVNPISILTPFPLTPITLTSFYWQENGWISSTRILTPFPLTFIALTSFYWQEMGWVNSIRFLTPFYLTLMTLKSFYWQEIDWINSICVLTLSSNTYIQ